MQALTHQDQGPPPLPEEEAAALGEGATETEFVAAETGSSMGRGTLLLVGLLALAAGAVYFMYLRSGPRPAAGATVDASAGQVVGQFLDAGPQSLRNMERMLLATERVVQQFLAYPSAPQVPLTDLQTNPFRLVVPTPVSAAADDAAARARREEQRQAVLREVQSLQLQSVIHSDTRRACMVNNTLYQEGQQIDGFLVERISPSTVIVKNGPYRFELKMQR